MRRLIAVVVLGIGTVGAIGCAGNATLVRKSPDGTAVIALKAGAPPADAAKQAAKELGGEVDIVTSYDPNRQPGATATDPNVMHYVFKLKGQNGGMGVGGNIGQVGFQGQMGGGAVMPAGGTGMPVSGRGAGVMPAGGAGMPAGSSTFGSVGAGQPPAMFPNSQ